MNSIEQMKTILAKAEERPESHPEIRAHTLALQCVADVLADVLADFDRRLRQIERRIV